MAAKKRAGTRKKKTTTRAESRTKTKRTTKKRTTKGSSTRRAASSTKARTRRAAAKATTSRTRRTAAKSTTSRSRGAAAKSTTSRSRRTTTRSTTPRTRRTTTRPAVSRARRTTARSTAPPREVPRTAQVLDNAAVPTLALEEHTPHMTRGKAVQDETCGSTKFAWLGSGQCGGRLAESFYNLGYRKALAVNTAYHDLEGLSLPDDQKFMMDIGRKGAGKEMARGRDAAIHYRQEIVNRMKRIFGDGVDHIMLTFGCGGGTGSGSAVPLVETITTYAKHIGLSRPAQRTGVLCTLPTVGEAASPRVAANAGRVLGELTTMAAQGKISPLIIVDNQKISRMYPGLTVTDFLPTINNTVSGLFDIFNRLSALPSPYIAFDSVDYQSIIRCGGCAIMGLTKVDTFHESFDLAQAIKGNLSKTLLADGFDLETAKVVGSIVVGGRSIFRNTPGLQDKIDHAFDALTDITGDATVHRGILEDEKPSIRVYTMIGGLDAPHERLARLREAA